VCRCGHSVCGSGCFGCFVTTCHNLIPNSFSVDVGHPFCRAVFIGPLWCGTAWIDDGRVVVGSSVGTFKSAVVFVACVDGALKSVCLRTPLDLLLWIFFGVEEGVSPMCDC
jgi:hypothetical protein